MLSKLATSPFLWISLTAGLYLLGGKLKVKWPLNPLFNPLVFSITIIIGILIGFVWSILKIPQPPIFSSTIQSIAALATPLGLMAMGSAFDLQKAKAEIAPALAASVIKLILLVMIFLPLAVLFGFHNQELVALLVMLGSASTVSCYIMAKNMGHDGTLTASTIMMTTFGCAFTLTFWLYLLRSLQLI